MSSPPDPASSSPALSSPALSSPAASSPQLGTKTSDQLSVIPAPTESEVSRFFSSLASCDSKPAILALVEPYSDDYIPSSMDEGLSMCLSLLYTPENLHLNYNELLEKATQVNISITSEETALVESKTRGQATSRLWFRMRTGRITASRFKSTDLTSPSLSLIMSICHPETVKFKTSATAWGCEHESTARALYKDMLSKVHQGFVVSECGLFISIEHPYIGASPDGLVSCLCCGKGIFEIKVNMFA